MKAKLSDIISGIQEIARNQESEYIELSYNMFLSLFAPQINNADQVIPKVEELSNKTKYCSKSDFARFIVVSRVTLDDWIEKGIVITATQKGRNKPVIDTEETLIILKKIHSHILN